MLLLSFDAVAASSVVVVALPFVFSYVAYSSNNVAAVAVAAVAVALVNLLIKVDVAVDV